MMGQGAAKLVCLHSRSELGEHTFHLSKRGNLAADVGQTVLGDPADRAAAPPSFKAHQLANLIEAEALWLGALHETNPIDHCDWISSYTAGAMWDS